MNNTTRLLYHAYLQSLQQLNHVPNATEKFSVDPSVQQTMETRIQESSEFLRKINIVPVDEMEGEKVGISSGGPIASRTNTSAGNPRKTAEIGVLDGNRYRCEQTNYDTHLGYKRLDQWASQPAFQQFLRDVRLQQIARDRIMIGFNGESVAATTDRATYPLLQDVNIGWLQDMRNRNAARVMDEDGTTAGKILIGAGNPFENLDALVFGLVNEMIAPWYQDDTGLVVICGRSLLGDKYFPLINTTQPPTEQIAADMIISQKRLGGLSAVRVPFFPVDALLVTRLDNLSIYFQRGKHRMQVKDAPEFDCIQTFESSNDAYVIEDYSCAAMAENIEIAL